MKIARRSSRPEPVSRNGLSLPRNDCPFPGPHSGIEAPGLLLRRLCRAVLRSVRLAAPPLSPVSPGSGEIDTANPSPETCPATSTYPRISAPLQGLLNPSGSKHRSDSRLRGSPSGCVRWPFAPRRRFYWNSADYGSTFRARINIYS